MLFDVVRSKCADKRSLASNNSRDPTDVSIRLGWRTEYDEYVLRERRERFSPRATRRAVITRYRPVAVDEVRSRRAR